MAENNIFNKRSLEALDAKDDIMESARVTRPSLTIVLCAMLVMCAARQYLPSVSDYTSFGRGEIIWRDDNGVLAGATEPRADGTVAAW